MSLSLLLDFEFVDERVVMGVKKRVKRLGVMDGWPLGLLLARPGDDEGRGEDGRTALLLCDEGSISWADMIAGR